MWLWDAVVVVVLRVGMEESMCAGGNVVELLDKSVCGVDGNTDVGR